MADSMKEIQEMQRRKRMEDEWAEGVGINNTPYFPPPMNMIGDNNPSIGYDNGRNIGDIVGGSDTNSLHKGNANGMYALDAASFLAGAAYMKGMMDGMKMAGIYGEGANPGKGMNPSGIYGEGASHMDGMPGISNKAIINSYGGKGDAAYGKGDAPYGAYGSKGASPGRGISSGGKASGGRAGYAGAGKGAGYSSGGKGGSSGGSGGGK